MRTLIPMFPIGTNLNIENLLGIPGTQSRKLTSSMTVLLIVSMTSMPKLSTESQIIGLSSMNMKVFTMKVLIPKICPV